MNHDNCILTLLHSERPTLYAILAYLSAIVLKYAVVMFSGSDVTPYPSPCIKHEQTFIKSHISQYHFFLPSSSALCANIGPCIQSPMAYMLEKTQNRNRYNLWSPFDISKLKFIPNY